MNIQELLHHYQNFWLHSPVSEELGFSTPPQQSTLTRMQELFDTRPQAFWRHEFDPGHFTGSAVVCDPTLERVALTHHRKLGFWLQFGGHADGKQDLALVALREAQEESGLSQLDLRFKGALDMDIHLIPAKGNEPQHQHFDACFLFTAPLAELVCSPESHQVRWFSMDQAEALDIDEALRRRLAKVRAHKRLKLLD